MLEITEVLRRASLAGEYDMSHQFITSPVVGQLLDPEYHGANRTVLLTAPECIALGQLIEAQSCALDEAEAGCHEGLALSQALAAKLTRAYYCAVMVCCFLVGLAIGVVC